MRIPDSRSAFQRWRRFETSPREDEDRTLLPMIISIFHRHRRRYGTRRIVDELADREIYCSRRRVAKLLKIAGLKAIQPKSFKPRTTESKHSLGYSPNLILDLAEPHRAKQLWVGDITYIPTVGLGFMDNVRFVRSNLWLFPGDFHNLNHAASLCPHSSASGREDQPAGYATFCRAARTQQLTIFPKYFLPASVPLLPKTGFKK